jgi:hypothetical protein
MNIRPESTAADPIESSSTLARWLNISHELRTPANAILGHVELLLSGAMGPLTGEMRASLGNIQQASLDLMAQIDQAVRIGETLPFSDPASPDIDALVEPLNGRGDDEGSDCDDRRPPCSSVG